MEKIQNMHSNETLQNIGQSLLTVFLLGLSFLLMVNGLGLKFAVYLMIIFLCKEVGYYLALKKKGHYYYPAYVLPFPYPFGSLGTFRSIKSIKHNSKLDIHVHTQGVFYAFIASVIMMFMGLKASGFSDTVEHGYQFLWGHNLLSTFLHYVLDMYPKEGSLLNYDPLYLAGLAGSFTCALVLLPIGQLNGGFIARQVLGDRYIWLSGFCCVVLFVLGFTHHYVWHMIMSMFLLFTYNHQNENKIIKKPTGTEKIKVFLCLLIFILCFIAKPYVFSI
ncbi:MAG TPA: hypothetical protein PKC21_07390 [Oligoflexia bacterium]|nr:hypothetical protein [Oligoflexia bacterium]HMR25160.1 hypothetical protein [Oligoflexia bacterium]